MCHRQQRTRLFDRTGHHHPRGAGKTIVELPAQDMEELLVAGNGEDGTVGHTGNTPCGERANPCVLTGTVTCLPDPGSERRACRPHAAADSWGTAPTSLADP